MALGAMIVGLPTAVAITLILAIPVYLLIRRTVGITLARVVAGGGGIGRVQRWLSGCWHANGRCCPRFEVS